jgi:hypothetical protein
MVASAHNHVNGTARACSDDVNGPGVFIAVELIQRVDRRLVL